MKGLINFNDDLYEDTVSYLKGEGLISTDFYDKTIKITHNGIRQIADALSNKNKETKYFPPVNVMIVGNLNNSQIQQGNTNSTQTMNIKEDYKKLKETLQELKVLLSALDLSENVKDELMGIFQQQNYN